MGKNLLITGAHRSGTTWIGKVLNASPYTTYHPEPFNPAFNHSLSPIKYWFHHLSPIEKNKDFEIFLNTFQKNTSYRYVRNLLEIRGRATLIEKLTKIKECKKGNIQIFKDPIAFFSAEWLYNQYDLNVIICIRHPAAFISSLKVKNWNFDFKNLNNQPALTDGLLKDFKKEIKAASNNELSIIQQGILLWNIIYSTTLEYMEKYNNWYFITNEKLSADPIGEYQKICSYTGIPFDLNIKKFIEDSTSKENSNTLKHSLNDSVYRNSMENVKAWKIRLSDSEIEKIKKDTEKVWVNFYKEDDWL